MTLIIIEFVIVLVGLAVTAVLFYRIPTLPVVNGNLLNYPTISVIIPARNEEHISFRHDRAYYCSRGSILP